MLIIIREVVMIERELGNWKDFIEVCFVNNFLEEIHIL
ncbi:protein YpfM [Citrobacter freundii]|nr:protein YpfM [Citrobacter freundii]